MNSEAKGDKWAISKVIELQKVLREHLEMAVPIDPPIGGSTFEIVSIWNKILKQIQL
jgi:hypothetical protein